MAREPKLTRRIVERSLDTNRVQRLLTQAGVPLVALRIRHPSWIAAPGRLQGFSISAAQKLVRRGLDSLFQPSMVALGRFKIFVRQSEYVIELHLVVAGATRIKLERAFDDARAAPIKSIRRAIDNMLSGRLQIRFGAWKSLIAYGEELDPSHEQWLEYIAWLRKHSGRLLFRYGCDRYWNKLDKHPRQMKSKVKKGHPDPHWLEPFQFGGPFWDQNVVERRLPRPPRLSRLTRRRLGLEEDPDYFNLEDDE
jgi:hypothetical protein